MLNIVGHNLRDKYGTKRLYEILEAAGIPSKEVHFDAPRCNITVAMGDDAARRLIADWPKERSAQTRRGYMWLGRDGGKVLVTLTIDNVIADRSGVSEMLVIADFVKAWGERDSRKLVRPDMDVEVITRSIRAAEVAKELLVCGLVACDIEITREWPSKCLCVGFAPSATKAYVFTKSVLGHAFKLLEDDRLGKVFQNGQFDLHFLLTRHQCRVAGSVDDTIVAWHTRWPEIAGAKTDLQGNKKGGIRRTRKSLLFFGSLYTNAEYWKDYDVDEEGMYVLNGKDCCITMLVWLEMWSELVELGLTEVYEMTKRRIWPVVEMQARGLLVNDQLRRQRISQLAAKRTIFIDELQLIARPLLEERRDKISKPHLIWQKVTCKCCRNGKAARQACVNCAGLPKGAKLGELRAAALAHIRGNGGGVTQKAAAMQAVPNMKKAQLLSLLLKPCTVCNGVGQWEEYAFNPASNDQLAMLLFDVLKLPRRESVDETSLKGLLGWISGEMRDMPQAGELAKS